MQDSHLDSSPAPSVTSSLTNNFSGVLTESSRTLTTTSTGTSTSQAPPKQTCPPTSSSSFKTRVRPDKDSSSSKKVPVALSSSSLEQTSTMKKAGNPLTLSGSELKTSNSLAARFTSVKKEVASSPEPT
ncbi:uncharacterized protein LOC143240643 [Tachypleus tridentatus]|uniref:uncharacterized protein LOC143240504 n=1 Tax=Tachypleus tridentatus TaxID=6853 RepID=UPI003FD56C30